MALATLFSAKAATYDSDAIDTGRKDISVHVYSASTSSATVKIQESLDGTHWVDAVTITNPTSTGEKWSIPAEESEAYTRVSISAWASGSITCIYNLETRSI